MKYIVPCAGYGTRMNMKTNESKEMLIDPSTGLRLIDNVLSLAEKTGASVHVITRIEKQDLIEYLKPCPGIPKPGEDRRRVTIQIVEPGVEWANTVLASEKHWDDQNILILPDTKWEPGLEALIQIEESLKLGCYSAFAVHKVKDVSCWGQISDYSITEKPMTSGEGYAWGLVGFNKNEGLSIFSMSTIKNNKFGLMNSSFVFLDSFKDLTRTGKIE